MGDLQIQLKTGGLGVGGPAWLRLHPSDANTSKLAFSGWSQPGPPSCTALVHRPRAPPSCTGLVHRPRAPARACTERSP